MEKAKITFENEEGDKKITATFSDTPEKGMLITIDYGSKGTPDHTKGLYLALANYFLNQLK